jgi:hypothetical protein
VWQTKLTFPYLDAVQDLHILNYSHTLASILHILCPVMPKESSPRGAVGLSKPTTRSSIRQSLNLASVGKALVDVINKDGRDAEKTAKKAKEVTSRRSSTMNLMQGSLTSRTSLDSKTGLPSIDSKTGRPSLDSVSSLSDRRVVTPDSRTITRHTRRSSGLPKPTVTSSDESAAQGDSVKSFGITRSASLRPKGNVVSSALPKYRPKSVVLDSCKPPSPPRKGTRRRLSSSEDEKEDQRMKCRSRTSQSMLQSPADKTARPISPLPQRKPLNLTSAVNVAPSTPPRRKVVSSSPQSSLQKVSPARPTKSAKTSAVSSPTRTAIPRPPSSTSSTGSPRSPKTPTSARSPLVSFRSGHDRASPSPLRSSNHAPPELPITRHSRKDSTNGAPIIPARATASAKSSTSPIVEEDSEDDVEMLLPPEAPLGGPTPAMPREQRSRNSSDNHAETPTRISSNLPNRNRLSYLSPDPPSSENSRRPTSHAGDGRPRGSLLSWEQLATENSRTLRDDEIDKMLADIPPPFRSGDISPRHSAANPEISESPMLSAFNSPGAYGSISQVLLPDATPSPGVHEQQRYQSAPVEIPAVDAATVTLLRLQLAAAEHVSKERLSLMQSMEDEVHLLKETRAREGEELSKQVSFLEEQLRSDLAARERRDEEQAAYNASLEDQLRKELDHRKLAVANAIAETREAVQVSLELALGAQRRKWEAGCAAHQVTMTWASALALAEGELDLVRANKEASSISCFVNG